MKRTKYRLSHGHDTTFNMGQAVPVGVIEVLPGDTFQMATKAILRLQALGTPAFARVHVNHAWIWGPSRTLWEEFEDLVTGGPDNDSLPQWPTINSPAVTGFEVGSLGDHMGIPVGVPNRPVNALPFRLYAKWWNENIRDQDLQNELPISYASGPDTTTSTALQRVAWHNDYFTASRPWEQKGPSISIPLTGDAPVLGIGAASTSTTTNVTGVRDSAGNTVTYNPGYTTVGGTAGVAMDADGVNGFPEIFADLTGVDAVEMTELRLALALQRYGEARARYGSRYVEYLRYLGVRSSDARLQRTEYLTGGSDLIQFSEVLQTAPSEDQPVGQMYGHGISGPRTRRSRRFFEEHGYILVIAYVRPEAVYTDGLERLWNVRTKEDLWQKELQHIGQQEIQNKEVYWAHASPDATFSYGNRYDQYRRLWSKATGEFRPGQVLGDWTFARSFDSAPALNSDFITCDPTLEPFAIQNQDTLLYRGWHSIQARRLVGSPTSFIL